MQEVDLTKGNLSVALLRFSLPVILLCLFHALYGLIDLFMIGHLTKGGVGVSAVAIGFSSFFIFMLFIFGIAMGGTVMIGNAYGARQKAEIQKIVGTMMTTFLILGVLGGILLFIIAPNMVKFLRTPLEVVPDTIAFIRICSLGVFFISGLNVIGAALRGIGNSHTPLVYVGFSLGINTILDFIFLYFFGWGVKGVAIATVTAQGVGVIFAIWYLRHKNCMFKFRMRDFCFYPDKAKKMLRLGVPISLQDVLVNISFLLIFSLANKMGVASSAAYGIGQRLYGFTMLPAFSLAMSLTALTAQHVGANFIHRSKQALFMAISYAYVFCSLFFFIQMLFPEWVIRIFTNDPAVIAAGKDYLLSSSWELLLIAPYVCLIEFFNGCGKTIFTMISGISVTFLVRIPAAVLLTWSATATLYDLGWSTVIASSTELLILIIAFKTRFWHKDKPILMAYYERYDQRHNKSQD